MSDNQSAAEVPYQSVAAPPSDVPSTVVSGGGGLLAMIERLATNPQLNIEVFDRLLKARREEEDRAAERAFNSAMSQAKGEFTPIIKTHIVDYPHKDGRGRTSYKHEELADISAVVDPILSKYGLSYRHRTVQTGGKITVTCILSHADGHSEENSLDGVEDTSGQKNSNQSIASTVTYLQRYTLKQGLGLAAGRDNDGQGEPSPKISVEQANELQKLIDQTGRSQATLLRLVGVDEVVDMTVDQFTRAKEVLGLAKAEKARKNAPAGNG